MATKILSIEIGQGFTKVVEMDYKVKNPKIYHCFSFETPRDMITDGVVKRSESFAVKLHDQLEERGIKTDKVVFTVTSTRIASREAVIPFVNKNKIQAVVNANAMDYFPVDMTQYHIVYDVVGKEEGEAKDGKKADKKLRLSLLAVPNELTASYFELAGACRLSVQAIDFSGNSVRQIIKAGQPIGYHMLIKVEEKNSLLTIFEGENIALQRNIAYGIDEAIQTLRETKAFGEDMSYAGAIEVLRRKTCIRRKLNVEEGYKEEEDTAEDVTAARIEITESLRYLIGNISRVIDYFMSRNTEAVIDHINLIGLGADFSGLSKLITNEIGHKVTVLQNFEGASFSQKMNDEKVPLCVYAACIGAGLAPLNLVADTNGSKKRTKKDSDSFALPLLISGLCIGASIILMGMVTAENMSLRSENTRLNNRIVELQPAEVVYNDYNQTKTNYDGLMSMYNQTKNPNQNLVAFLEEMEKKMPSEVRVLSMNSTLESLSMNMQVGSKEAAAKVIEQLRSFESLENIQVASISDTTNEVGTKTVAFSVNAGYKGFGKTEAAPAATVENEEETAETVTK